MIDNSARRLQIAVFSLVAAAFANIYLTQPVLPVLGREFGADIVAVSFSVSAVILGIALANLPFGILADRLPIRPLILSGSAAVGIGGAVCAVTDSLWLLIAARFWQGLFIPALTTCLAAHLAKTLPVERLSVVMGSYVAATVLGGLGGRLLGGLIHPPLHWRWAFVSASLLIAAAALSTLRLLPSRSLCVRSVRPAQGFVALLLRPELLRIFVCAAGGLAVFSSIFNYLPFRLAAPPFGFSTGRTTLLYLTYVVGIVMGPTAGRISSRFGSGAALLGGTAVFAGALLIVRLPSTVAVVFGLLGVCAGFFTVHAAAVGALNRRLTGGQGRANALYVMFYYLGGWSGITVTGMVYQRWGWDGLVSACMLLLMIPLGVGWMEHRGRFRRA